MDLLRCLPWIAILPLLAGPCATAQTKLFVDSTNEELTHAVPDLAGMQFDPDQKRLEPVLSAAGEELADMFDKLVNLSATEQIHEMKFGEGAGDTSRTETYRYQVKLLDETAPEPFDELRLDPATGSPASQPNGGFLVSGHFEKLLRYMLPEYGAESRFRYLGRAPVAGQDAWLLAFAQNQGSARLYSNIGIGNNRTAKVQGLVWIDVATHRIVRLRTGMAEQVEGFPLQTLTTDIAVVPVKFQPGGDILWLPGRVTVHGRYAGGELHTVHRYSDYRSSGGAAVPAVALGTADDPWEMLDRAAALAHENKPTEAIALLRDALRAAPSLAPAHNLLGVLLFQQGDAAGAAAAMRARLQLEPDAAAAHFSLAQVLEKSDPKTALSEYRTAANLEPGNAAIKARLDRLEHASAAPATLESTGATIKVEVRQVLVPVVVTDKQGHHVTGLTRADFHVFEDGVEQKITAFSVENSGTPTPPPAPDAPPPTAVERPAAAAAAAPRKPAAVRRTYLVCIDSLHSAFSNLVYVRKALTKLFAAEPSGDARYVLVAVGSSTQLLQAPTTDPAAVLKAIESKEFQKLFIGSRAASIGDEMRSFRRDLDAARAACDSGDPSCKMLVAALPPRANQIADEEHIYTVSFLHEVRNLVTQLAKESGRRTMVLLSDGFQLVPGKQAFELLDAYFPGTHASLRSTERMTELDPILRLAADRNIPIYTVDSRGLYTQSYFDASNPGSTVRLAPAVLNIMSLAQSEAGETLTEIAAATGGTASRNTNDIFAGVERAFADGRQYYVLAYVPVNANADGKFRAISVRARDSKWSVNAKRGYWAVREGSGPPDPQTP